MERRNRSIEALNRLQEIDSMELATRAESLLYWSNEYLKDQNIEDFTLNTHEMKRLSELFYKNINFIKQYRIEIKSQLDSQNKIIKFFQ